MEKSSNEWYLVGFYLFIFLSFYSVRIPLTNLLKLRIVNTGHPAGVGNCNIREAYLIHPMLFHIYDYQRICNNNLKKKMCPLFADVKQ